MRHNTHTCTHACTHSKTDWREGQCRLIESLGGKVTPRSQQRRRGSQVTVPRQPACWLVQSLHSARFMYGTFNNSSFRWRLEEMHHHVSLEEMHCRASLEEMHYRVSWGDVLLWVSWDVLPYVSWEDVLPCVSWEDVLPCVSWGALSCVS